MYVYCILPYILCSIVYPPSESSQKKQHAEESSWFDVLHSDFGSCSPHPKNCRHSVNDSCVFIVKIIGIFFFQFQGFCTSFNGRCLSETVLFVKFRMIWAWSLSGTYAYHTTDFCGELLELLMTKARSGADSQHPYINLPKLNAIKHEVHEDKLRHHVKGTD